MSKVATMIEPRQLQRFAPRGRMMLVAVCGAALALVLSTRDRFPFTHTVDPLLAPFVNSAVRVVEPRLSGGFRWAPLQRRGLPAVREDRALVSPPDSTQSAVRGEAVSMPRRSDGIFLLLTGKTREALAVLTEAAESANDASTWNDLCAAYYEAAIRFDAPELLTEALTASDRALALDPTMSEALFNRALTIERLGLRTDARKAWVRFLQADVNSGWTEEARAHLTALRIEKPFMEILDGDYDAIAGDRAAAKDLYEHDPFNARGQALKHVLGRWGDALTAGDSIAADRHLRVARNLGSVVADGGGDRTLEDAVATIDGASDSSRTILAAAHTDYRDGLEAFRFGHPLKAEPLLRRAAAAFRQARSPMSIPALYFAANAVYEQGRHDEAEQQIAHLLVSDTPSPAFRAFIHWQLGICRRSRADWGAAISHFEQSAAIFEQLGEAQNVTTVRRLLAFVYDRVGDPELGWRNRMATIRGTRGSSSPLVHEKTVSSIAEAALLRKEWHTAESFLTLHADISRRTKDNVLLVDALHLRAVVRDRLGNRSGVNADLAESKAVAARIQDPTYRAAARVTELRATAMLSTTPGSLAEVLLSEAISLRSTQSDPASLPILLLQRGRARRASGNHTAALTDIEAGIEELEKNRESIPEGETRWGAFNGAEELFEEGIDLALSRNDPPAAWRFAERARVRALLDAYGSSPEADPSEMPPRTIAVEYVSLPDRVVIFTVGRAGVHAQSVAYPRDRLIKDVAALTRSFGENTSLHGNTEASSMYRRLVTPVATRFAADETIVFVPDATMATVPFGALTDSAGVPLLQRHSIIVSGSVAAFIAASQRRRTVGVPRNAVLISASEASADLQSLRAVGDEVREIATAYSGAASVREGIEWSDIVRYGPNADVIHFSGHAIGDDRGWETASIVVRQNARTQRVGVGEIAKLRLRRAPTVVLAGCSTARGQRRAAEGVISVAHGFLTAGAPSVIATLWPIDDRAAAKFFPRLHRRLAAGMAPSAALRGAQLESIQRGDVPASLWAAIENFGS